MKEAKNSFNFSFQSDRHKVFVNVVTLEAFSDQKIEKKLLSNKRVRIQKRLNKWLY